MTAAQTTQTAGYGLATALAGTVAVAQMAHAWRMWRAERTGRKD